VAALPLPLRFPPPFRFPVAPFAAVVAAAFEAFVAVAAALVVPAAAPVSPTLAAPVLVATAVSLLVPMFSRVGVWTGAATEVTDRSARSGYH
jgi:hypothetical protein